ncbi:MAG TPA: hypothetical protein PK587_05305, partial [Syntrophales bacterium]|nr:hypothetical protein [Syntrophales bacterium]
DAVAHQARTQYAYFLDFHKYASFKVVGRFSSRCNAPGSGFDQQVLLIWQPFSRAIFHVRE